MNDRLFVVKKIFKKKDTATSVEIFSGKKIHMKSK